MRIHEDADSDPGICAKTYSRREDTGIITQVSETVSQALALSEPLDCGFLHGDGANHQ